MAVLEFPMKEESRHRSLRETLILRWREDGRLGTAGSDTERRRIALLFGPGGVYEIEDLRAGPPCSISSKPTSIS
jgi:hypothetical protein